MLISETINKAINQQIGNEFSASLRYVTIASYFASESLPELAKYFYKQEEEERAHAMRFVKFLVDAGGHVVIPTISSPQSSFKSAEDAVKLSLESEKKVTQQINALVDLAIKESNRATENFLQWFVAEQFEEVSSMDKLLKLLQRAGEKRLISVENYLARQGLESVKPLS